jgi:hypothetical protein
MVTGSTSTGSVRTGPGGVTVSAPARPADQVNFAERQRLLRPLSCWLNGSFPGDAEGIMGHAASRAVLQANRAFLVEFF